MRKEMATSDRKTEKYSSEIIIILSYGTSQMKLIIKIFI